MEVRTTTIEVNGEKLEVIDAHTQMGISPIIRYFSVLGKDRHLGEEAIILMDEVGVDKAIAWPEYAIGSDYAEANRLVAGEMKKYPDRIIGWGRLNPGLGPESCVRIVDEMCRDLGLKGLKLHPLFDYHVANDEVFMYPIMERVRKYKIPVLFHSGEVWTASPALIGDLADNFPEVPILIAHLGILEYAEDAIVVAKKRDNVFLETSISAWTYHIGKAVKEAGPEKVIFGSDAPYQPVGFELDKLVKYSRLTTDQLRKILAENIKGILRMK